MARDCSAVGARLAWPRDRRQRALPRGHAGRRSTATTGDLGAAARGRASRGDFVWIGLHEPTSDELARRRRRLRPAPAGRRGRRQGPPAAQARALRATSLFLVLKTLWYVDERGRGRDRRDQHLRRPRLRGHRPARPGRRAARGSRATSRRGQQVLSHGPSAVVYAVCDLVVDGYERGGRRARGSTSTRSRRRSSPSERTDDSARIYILKREIAEVRRAVLPLREPMRRFVAGSVARASRAEAAPFFRDVADHLRAGRRDHRHPRRPAVDRLRRPPRPDLGAAERGHAQDLRRGRAGRRADADRRRSTA